MAQPSVGVASGKIIELTETSVMVRDADGGRWVVPRSRLPATARVGDRVTVCALHGEHPDRDELARGLLNALLGS